LSKLFDSIKKWEDGKMSNKLNFENAVNLYISFLNYLGRLTDSLKSENEKLADRWSKVNLKSDPAEVDELRFEYEGLSRDLVRLLVVTVTNYEDLKEFIRDNIDKDEYTNQLIIFYNTGREKKLDAAIELLEIVLGREGLEKLKDELFKVGDFVYAKIANKITAFLKSG
jgi:hypothetical protein